MQLKKFKALWGMDGTLQEQFSKIADAGYRGVEAPLPASVDAALFKELLEKHRLEYIAQIFADDIHAFENGMIQAAEFKPVLVNSQSAKDHMPFSEQLVFFDAALKLEKEAGIPVGHETHRGRAMFTPWNTAHLLRELEELKITADFSHWVCVCESLLQSQSAHLDLAISRTVHIHTRVGYIQGPQVPDPRAPEYKTELDLHISWWKAMLQQAKDGNLTFTPEYGPPGYMHTMPFTGEPIADLWDVCLWMGNYVEEQLQRPE
ncbi:sugar phosphate isomerase/epimerase [Bacillus mangrovi]|uniref:Sugar phosphate isomerase/epimerase n=1 Tax=Metabacillus mangrovi TaxID=1491830 RepID=A0A7X2S8K5_9BACI|nr:sugar phosphate isomerase/epimerase [Metabacillus mangrovi]MTH55614.1 sugar phosphate isomerase/epimerase [Metabacillus mangrovi]